MCLVIEGKIRGSSGEESHSFDVLVVLVVAMKPDR